MGHESVGCRKQSLAAGDIGSMVIVSGGVATERSGSALRTGESRKKDCRDPDVLSADKLYRNLAAGSGALQKKQKN